jgi:hypothetical protein
MTRYRGACTFILDGAASRLAAWASARATRIRPVDEAEDSNLEDEESDHADEDDGTRETTAADLKALVSQPARLTRAAGIIGKCVPPDDVNDFVNDAVVEAQSATKLPRIGKFQEGAPVLPPTVQPQPGPPPPRAEAGRQAAAVRQGGFRSRRTKALRHTSS